MLPAERLALARGLSSEPSVAMLCTKLVRLFARHATSAYAGLPLGAFWAYWTFFG